ncbi:hypothetical protein B0H14DRAFT_2821585, partial [Mycena olivaceomarginata]
MRVCRDHTDHLPRHRHSPLVARARRRLFRLDEDAQRKRHRYAPPPCRPAHRTFAKVGAAVYHGGHGIIVARNSRCTRVLPSVPFPTAALIPSLSGVAHRRTALLRVRSLSGSRLSLGLPKRFQSFLRLHAHPDPLLRPAPLRYAMDICSHIYPSLDPVLTPPLRVRPVSSCLRPH